MKSHLEVAAEHMANVIKDIGSCCTLRRPDTEGEYVPGSLESPTEVKGDVYYTGECLLNEVPHQSRTTPVSGTNQLYDTYRGRIPFDADLDDEIRAGDILTVTESTNAHLVGEEFTVVDVRLASLHASRQFGLRSTTYAPKVL